MFTFSAPLMARTRNFLSEGQPPAGFPPRPETKIATTRLVLRVVAILWLHTLLGALVFIDG